MAKMKIFDKEGKPGIAVYRAKKQGDEWKFLYVWVDYYKSSYIDGVTGEFISRGYYMYVYYGTQIASMLSYDAEGVIGKVFIGWAEKNTKRNYTRHAALVTYWGEEVLKELFPQFLIDYEKNIHIKLSTMYSGTIFPTRFIMESFPIYKFKAFWSPEKWDRLPMDSE